MGFDCTVKLQWLEHRWLVYHGYFELPIGSIGTHPIAANIITFGIILSDFLFYIDNGILYVLIRIASMSRFYEKTHHTLVLKKIEKLSVLCFLAWRYD